MRKYLTVLTMTLTVHSVFAQPKEYCKNLRAELNQMMQSNNNQQVKITYHKLLYTCGVSDDEKLSLTNYYRQHAYKIDWNSDQSYHISGRDFNTMETGVFPFDKLDRNHPIKEKYTSVEKFLKAAGFSDKSSSATPVFIPEYNIVAIYHNTGYKLLSTVDLKTLIELEGGKNRLAYAGFGMFYQDRQMSRVYQDKDKCIVYSIEMKNGNPVLKTVIDKPNADVTFFSDSPRDIKHYFLIRDFSKNTGRTTLYDFKGKIVFDEQDNIEVNPATGMIILYKEDEGYKLINADSEVLFQTTNSINEMGKYEEPYYIVTDDNNKKQVVDKHGKLIFSGTNYDLCDIFGPNPPYAIVKNQDERYGVLDFTTQKMIIPYQKERILPLYIGFFTWEKNGVCTIVDDKNQKTGSVQTTELRSMGAGLVRTYANGYYGAYNLLGKEILPQQYDEIYYDIINNIMEVKQGQKTFKTDINGKEIK